MTDLFLQLRTEPAPLLLGFILGRMMEENLRRALLLSRGTWSVFVSRRLSAGLLVAALLLLGIVLLPSIKAKRQEASSKTRACAHRSRRRASRGSRLQVLLGVVSRNRIAGLDDLGSSPRGHSLQVLQSQELHCQPVRP
jgi:hypothetical protein